MEFETIRYEKAGHIATLTLNRPDVRNALNYQSFQDLNGAFVAAQADADIRCIILTGADPAFCSGDDVKQIMEKEAGQPSGAKALAARPRTVDATFTILNCEIPVIAAVNGAAVGWGMEMTLFCDIRLASERAKFAEQFVKRALIPDVGGLHRLPAIVGPSNAARLLYTGDVIDAAEAQRIGLVSGVYPHEALMDESRVLAERIAANAPLALRHIKEGLRRARQEPIEELATYCAGTWAKLRQTEDHLEGIRSFTEKRPAVFQGR